MFLYLVIQLTNLPFYKKKTNILLSVKWAWEGVGWRGGLRMWFCCGNKAYQRELCQTEVNNRDNNSRYHYIKDSKAEICRGAVGRGWGGNVCCGFVVNHTYQWWWGWAATAAAGLFTCRGSLPATPLRSQIIVTLLKSHCVPW